MFHHQSEAEAGYKNWKPQIHYTICPTQMDSWKESISNCMPKLGQRKVTQDASFQINDVEYLTQQRWWWYIRTEWLCIWVYSGRAGFRRRQCSMPWAWGGSVCACFSFSTFLDFTTLC
jgi:hypothetical protein